MAKWKQYSNAADSAFQTGRLADAFESRSDFAIAVRGARSRNEEHTKASARCAQLHLLMLEKQEAAGVLHAFIDIRDDSISAVREDALGEIRDNRTLSLVLAQLANIHYAWFQYAEGLSFADRAKATLESVRSTIPDHDWILPHAENDIWRARLLHRSGDARRAERMLEKTLLRLYEAMRQHEEIRGGAKLLAALALDVSASFDWSRGELARGARRIYQALSILLSEDGPSCPVRAGHAYYIAARLESVSSSDTFAWALELLDQSKAIFRDLDANHPYLGRAMLHAAQIHVKSGADEEAEKIFTELKTFNDRDSDESEFRRAELLLARLWMKEREARNGSCTWEDLEPLAREFASIERVPQRLAIEAKLHKGYVLAMIPESRESGISELHEARALARRHEFRKIEVAASFAESESWATSVGIANSEQRAYKWWSEGASLLRHVSSDFLSGWRDEIGAKLDGRLRIEFEPGSRYDDAMKLAEKQLLEYFERKASATGMKPWMLAKMKRSTWYKRKKAHRQ